MAKDTPGLDALMSLPPSVGGERRTLSVGPWAFAFEGLERRLAEALDARWGGFVSAGGAPEGIAPQRVRLAAGGPPVWLDAPRPGELYRIEGRADGGRAFVRSYHFALAEVDDSEWRLAVSANAAEPAPRILDNAARFLVGRRAALSGGLPLHAAAVLRNGKVHVLAGPSRSGKTTAASFAGSEGSLGDDFAVVIPVEKGWGGMALPFDNREAAPADPPRGVLPLAGVWRLFQAREDRVEMPSGVGAAASLLSCAAFPWTMPDLAGALATAAARIVAESRFGHLHFRPSAAFWHLLDAASRER